MTAYNDSTVSNSCFLAGDTYIIFAKTSVYCFDGSQSHPIAARSRPCVPVESWSQYTQTSIILRTTVHGGDIAIKTTGLPVHCGVP